MSTLQYIFLILLLYILNNDYDIEIVYILIANNFRNNEVTLKAQLAEYKKILQEIDGSLSELTAGSENSKSKAALLEELRLKREEEVKLNEDYK